MLQYLSTLVHRNRFKTVTHKCSCLRGYVPHWVYFSLKTSRKSVTNFLPAISDFLFSVPFILCMFLLLHSLFWRQIWFSLCSCFCACLSFKVFFIPLTQLQAGTWQKKQVPCFPCNTSSGSEVLTYVMCIYFLTYLHLLSPAQSSLFSPFSTLHVMHPKLGFFSYLNPFS